MANRQQALTKARELKGVPQPISLKPGTVEVHFNSKGVAGQFERFLKNNNFKVLEVSGPHRRNPFSISSQKPFWRIIFA